MVNVREDLTGQRFGRLIVVKQTEDHISPKGKHKAQWLCKCDCGSKEVVVTGDSLRQNKTLSCGCIHREIVMELNKKKKKQNNYDLSREYGIGYTYKGEKFYFDLEDYDLIKDYCWYTTKDGYIATNKNLNTIMLHRLIMNLPNDSFDVDHIRGRESRNDNRKTNLRLTTRSQNTMNAQIKSNNISGVSGVSFDKSNNKWIAYITIDYKQKHLGSFTNKYDAIIARKTAEEKYFGKYSYNNSKYHGGEVCV